jgi:hypothetical protein
VRSEPRVRTVTPGPAARLTRATFPRTQPCTGQRYRMDRPTSAAPASTSAVVTNRNPAGWRGDRRRTGIPLGASAARGGSRAVLGRPARSGQ